MNTLQMDFSTIDMDLLHKQPVLMFAKWSKQPSPSMGVGCFLNAPGHPSFFVQSYYQTSNSEGEPVIFDGEVFRKIPLADYFMNSLWKPLPYDSERVGLWIKAVYTHCEHMYCDPNIEKYDNLVQWPVPYYKRPLLTINMPHPYPKPDVYAALYETAQHARRAELKKVLQDAWAVAHDLRNHLAFKSTCKFYPYQAQIMTDYIKEPPGHTQGNWWERYDHLPTNEECPGNHKSKNTYCDVCGRQINEPPKKGYKIVTST